MLTIVLSNDGHFIDDHFTLFVNYYYYYFIDKVQTKFISSMVVVLDHNTSIRFYKKRSPTEVSQHDEDPFIRYNNNPSYDGRP